MRDFQRQKVYDWENEFVRPKMPTTRTSIEKLSIINDFMWNAMGFENAPRVIFNPLYEVKSTGSRYEIKLSKHQHDEFTLTHELAHSMNLMEHRDVYDHHGPNYVADYCTLLRRFYGFDYHYLVGTLSRNKIKINLGLHLENMSNV